jgi:hypothetical protein
MGVRLSRRRRGCVMVVSRRAETRAALAKYLEDSGVDVAGLDRAEVGRVPPRVAAVVFFPDEFSERRALDFSEAMRRVRPGALLIVVTREPLRLGALLAREQPAVAPIVLPKPSFSWSILDAIREHTSRGC